MCKKRKASLSTCWLESTVSYWYAYETETERLAWTVQRRLNGAEWNGSITVFLTAPFMPAVPFPFCMHACIISNWAWSFNVQKKKEGQLVNLPTRINSFILWSSKLFWGSSLLLLFGFEWVLRSTLEVCYRRSIDLVLPVDSDRSLMWSLG